MATQYTTPAEPLKFAINAPHVFFWPHPFSSLFVDTGSLQYITYTSIIQDSTDAKVAQYTGVIYISIIVAISSKSYTTAGNQTKSSPLEIVLSSSYDLPNGSNISLPNSCISFIVLDRVVQVVLCSVNYFRLH